MPLDSHQQAAQRDVKAASDGSSQTEMNTHRPAALQQIQSRLQNFDCEATWPSIYMAKLHTHTCASTSCESMGQSISGGVDEGRVLEAVETAP